MEERKTTALSHLSIFGYNKQKYSEEEILEGIKTNSDKMFRFIYKSYYSGIRSMVLGFRSLALDADDIFQDGLVAASANVVNGKFKGDSKFQTYLTSVCRNMCRKQLERAGRFGNADPNIDIADEPVSDEEDLIYRLTHLKNRMEEKCRQIIDLRFGIADETSGLTSLSDSGSNVPFEEVAQHLNIEPENARQRFKRCLERLKESVFTDHIWNDLLATTNR